MIELLSSPSFIGAAIMLLLLFIGFVWAVLSLFIGIRAQRNYTKASLPRLSSDNRALSKFEETEVEVEETAPKVESVFALEEYVVEDEEDLDAEELFLRAEGATSTRKRKFSLGANRKRRKRAEKLDREDEIVLNNP